MVQYHAAPADYLALMREAMPLYDRLQKEVADASREIRVERLLDLGVGTGETTARVLALHSPTVVVVVDASSAMLAVAAEELRGQVEFRTGHLEDPLPGDSWDLIVTALSAHHLDSVGKRDLFRRCAERLREGGRLVVGDVVVPLSSVPRPTPIDADVDFPDSVEAQLSWFSEVGLYPTLHWADGDLAVMSGTNVRA